jgi:hypothetical protein
MSVLTRPRFGQPCFDCGEPVSMQRIQAIQRVAESQRRRWLKSDRVREQARGHREGEAERIILFEHLPANSAERQER